MVTAVSLPDRFCVRARKETDGWQLCYPAPVDGEFDAASLILDAPEFLSFSVNGTAVFRAAMPAPIPGDQDRVLIAVNEKGRVVIVGCPDESKPDAHSSMVMGVLAACGRLWHLSYEDFASGFGEFLGGSLDRFVADKVGEDWSADQFRDGVTEHLNEGRFPMLVVGGRADGEAGEAIAYLKSMNMEVRSIGLGAYGSGGIEIAVPVTSAMTVSRPRGTAMHPNSEVRMSNAELEGVAVGQAGFPGAIREELGRRAGG